MKIDDSDYRHIEKTYDEGSDDYSGYFQQPHEFIEPERRQFIERLPTGSKILNCGCGPGMDTERFARLGYQVTAIDLSEHFVDLTQKLGPNSHVPKMDMRYLVFLEASFDGVWSSFSLLPVRASEVAKKFVPFVTICRTPLVISKSAVP